LSGEIRFFDYENDWFLMRLHGNADARENASPFSRIPDAFAAPVTIKPTHCKRVATPRIKIVL
jgi:hypothetical protein